MEFAGSKQGSTICDNNFGNSKVRESLLLLGLLSALKQCQYGCNNSQC